MSELFQIFPVPIYCNKAESDTFDEVQEELNTVCDKIEFSQMENWTRDTHELNKDPFQSNVLKKYNCEKTIKFLKECVNDYLIKTTPFDYNGFPFVIQSAWLTKTKKHHYAHEHHHGDADISGVYYIKTNGEDGNLQFDNINSSMSGNFIMGALTSKQVAPLDTGLLMLWPGPLKHGTQENKTDNERISLSFNVNIARPCFSYKDGAFD
tara:strand:+ start:921 stop:1547 length:627 start_codon:yes stop_codon:yes gene_type:complete